MREAARRLSTDVAGRPAGQRGPDFDDLVLPEPTSTRLCVRSSRGPGTATRCSGRAPLAGRGGKGRGIAALFAGWPGTGKTLAAHVVAGELGLDLHTVDLSAVVDKYIGETEKNLERVFDQAESLNVLLFFDEADALFGSPVGGQGRPGPVRQPGGGLPAAAHGGVRRHRRARRPTSQGSLDAAFSRRLHFIVHFPDPDAATRRRLWSAHLRAVSRLDPDDPVDVAHLGDVVEAAGGEVRNMVLAAAYASAAEGVLLGMRHVLRAVDREVRRSSGACCRYPISGGRPDGLCARGLPLGADCCSDAGSEPVAT